MKTACETEIEWEAEKGWGCGQSQDRWIIEYDFCWVQRDVWSKGVKFEKQMSALYKMSCQKKIPLFMAPFLGNFLP